MGIFGCGENSAIGRRKGQRIGREAGECLVCLRKDSKAGAEGDEVREDHGSVQVRTLALRWGEMGAVGRL